MTSVTRAFRWSAVTFVTADSPERDVQVLTSRYKRCTVDRFVASPFVFMVPFVFRMQKNVVH